jgi:hypothetical protein
MTDTVLYRLAGCAAMIAGLLRVGASFLPAGMTSAAALEWFYLVIDVAIAFALVGIYTYQHSRMGVVGFIGFVLALAGTESIGGPDGNIGDVDIYRAGAAVIGIGMVLLATGSLQAAQLPRYVAVLWIASTVVGLGSFVSPGSTLPFLLAGVAFGLGFIGAGIHMWRYPDPRLN